MQNQGYVYMIIRDASVFGVYKTLDDVKKMMKIDITSISNQGEAHEKINVTSKKIVDNLVQKSDEDSDRYDVTWVIGFRKVDPIWNFSSSFECKYRIIKTTLFNKENKTIDDIQSKFIYTMVLDGRSLGVFFNPEDAFEMIIDKYKHVVEDKKSAKITDLHLRLNSDVQVSKYDTYDRIWTMMYTKTDPVYKDHCLYVYDYRIQKTRLFKREGKKKEGNRLPPKKTISKKNKKTKNKK